MKSGKSIVQFFIIFEKSQKSTLASALKLLLLKNSILLVFILLNSMVWGQSPSPTFTINAIVIDSLNNKPIPFTSVHKKRDRQGTISGFDGTFSLENVRLNDTIICSYIGFEKLILIAKKEIHTVYLHRQSQLINEVIVLADDAILYSLMTGCKKTRSSDQLVSKTYFELESFHDETQLELFQGYYNGSFSGYDISSLGMKNGRFALAPISKRIFGSTATSKAMNMHKLFSRNDYFPTSPFELNRRQLFKSYTLNLNSKYKDDEDNTIYVIQFKPKEEARYYFQGRVWIDSLSNKIIKVNLKSEDASNYPFTSIWPNHTLNKVNLELTKTFFEIDGEMYVKSMDFNYSLDYNSVEDGTMKISTRAILYAYNYDDPFTLPFFHFVDFKETDYKKIQMMPYNELFWNCTNEFKVSTDEAQKKAFILDQTNVSDTDLFDSSGVVYPGKNFYEGPYVRWSKNRVLFRDDSPAAEKFKLNLVQGSIPSQRYNLEVQIYFDVNYLCDSLQIITKTVLDPYNTYYLFPQTQESKAFINMYFDIMEIERRKMDTSLRKCPNDIEQMTQVYDQAIIDAEKVSELYFKQMQRGTDRAWLIHWNMYIVKNLGIDNMYLFSLYEEVEE